MKAIVPSRLLSAPIRVFLPVLLILLAACSSTKNTASQAVAPKTVSVKNDHFVDQLNRTVILNGINVVSKNKEEGYIFRGGPEFYANLKMWGFNSIRFIIIWDGLEPEPGIYNQDYLQKIDQRIQWAADNNLFVILDMHQDLFSVKYADGAPEWATLDEGLEHITGDVWSDAYMISPAVQTSFDNFWANKSAADGVGLQDHYAALWKMLAERYKNNPAVIGYDLMNEPFPGLQAQQTMPAVLQAYGDLMHELTGEQQSMEQLAQTWGNVESRAKALKLLEKRENFARIADALAPLAHEFETQKLQPFYQKVANAIREADMGKIIFLEHSYYGNMGVKSSIERTTLPNGQKDPLVAYAPHGYDLVTDTENAAEASADRVAFIYGRIRETGERLQMPVWLGEWGAYYAHGEKIVPAAQQAIGEIEKNLFSNAYWSYDPGMEKQAYFQKAIIRPNPFYINGKLLNYHYNFQTGAFTMEWKEDMAIDAPTVLFIPDLSTLKATQKSFKKVKIKDSNAVYLVVPPSGNSEVRTLTFDISPE